MQPVPQLRIIWSVWVIIPLLSRPVIDVLTFGTEAGYLYPTQTLESSGGMDVIYVIEWGLEHPMDFLGNERYMKSQTIFLGAWNDI